MNVEEMERLGELAKKIKLAKDKLKTAEERLVFLKKHTTERENYDVNASWSPTLILKKGSNFGRDITFKVRLPYAVVEQQVVDDIKRAKRELIMLEGSAP